MPGLRKRFARVLLPAVIVIPGVQCGILEPGFEDVLLSATTLRVPVAATVGSTFKVMVDSIMLPDGCHTFQRVGLRDSDTTIELRALGTRQRDGVCTSVIFNLDPVFVDIPPRPAAGDLTVIFVQPSGETITEHVDVRQAGN